MLGGLFNNQGAAGDLTRSSARNSADNDGGRRTVNENVGGGGMSAADNFLKSQGVAVPDPPAGGRATGGSGPGGPAPIAAASSTVSGSDGGSEC